MEFFICVAKSLEQYEVQHQRRDGEDAGDDADDHAGQGVFIAELGVLHDLAAGDAGHRESDGGGHQRQDAHDGAHRGIEHHAEDAQAGKATAPP